MFSKFLTNHHNGNHQRKIVCMYVCMENQDCHARVAVANSHLRATSTLTLAYGIIVFQSNVNEYRNVL